MKRSSRENDFFGREKLNDETIIDFLQHQARELNLKVVLIENEDLNSTMFGRSELFEMLAIPTKGLKCLLNGTGDEIQKKLHIFEFCDLKYKSFGSINTLQFNPQNQRRFQAILNIFWLRVA